jgi:hypothetical protein
MLKYLIEDFINYDKPTKDKKMFTKTKSPGAQSIVEYVAVILIIVAVCAVAGIYYQRSIHGKYRETGDALGGGEQYHFPQ